MRSAILIITAILIASCAQEPDPAISGKVTRTDGTPVAGARVMIAYHLERLEDPITGRRDTAPTGHALPVHSTRDGQTGAGSGAFTADTVETNRIENPRPNPSCHGSQLIRFDLADSAIVTIFARSLHGYTDYDLLFMQPHAPGRHELNYQMLPGLYEINVTFLPDTLVSFMVPTVVDLDWDRGVRLEGCAGMDGYPAEMIDITDEKGRFSINQDDLIWRPRTFPVTAFDGAKHRLGVTAALFAIPPGASQNDSGPVRQFTEIDLSKSGHHVELTVTLR